MSSGSARAAGVFVVFVGVGPAGVLALCSVESDMMRKSSVGGIVL